MCIRAPSYGNRRLPEEAYGRVAVRPSGGAGVSKALGRGGNQELGGVSAPPLPGGSLCACAGSADPVGTEMHVAGECGPSLLRVHP